MWLEDKWMISVLRSPLPCNRSSSARNSWNKLSSQRKYSCQSLINNASLIHNMICAMRIMLVVLLDIFTNTLSKKRTQRLPNTFWRPMGAYVIWIKITFEFYANAAQSLNVLWTRCCWSKNTIHGSTQEPNLSFRNFFFKNILHTFAPAFNEVLSFSVVSNISSSPNSFTWE